MNADGMIYFIDERMMTDSLFIIKLTYAVILLINHIELYTSLLVGI